MDSAVLHVVLPELILAVGAMALLMIGVFTPGVEKAGRAVSWLAIGVLIAATAAVFAGTGTATVFDGAFVSDGLTRFLKILILVAAALTLLMTFDDFGRARLLLFEYPVLMLLAALGMLMMVSQTTSSLFSSALNCKIWLSMSSRPSNAMTSSRAKRASNILF